MIVSRLRILLLIAVFVYFIIVFQLLKQKTLNLKYTLLWLASGVVMLILILFPQLLQTFALLVGISAPINALFSMAFFCLIIILMSLTAIVSKQNRRNKDLIQAVALLEKRVRNLEEDAGKEPCYDNGNSH